MTATASDSTVKYQAIYVNILVVFKLVLMGLHALLIVTLNYLTKINY